MAEQQPVVGKSVESSGKTIDEAIENALARLGASREDVDVTILREASRGLLGFGAHEAIVKLTIVDRNVAPTLPNAAPTRDVDHAQAAPTEATRNVDRPRPAAQPAAEGNDDAIDAHHADDKVSDEEAEGVPEPQPTPPAPKKNNDVIAEGEDESEIARQILLGMIERMGLIADVQLMVREPEDAKDKGTIVLDVVGDDLGLLIGRQGSTLNDLQYITRQLVANKVGHWVNLMVDVEGYKQRREDRLRELARRIAKRVEDTGRPAHMEPMNSYERRLIHLELSKISGIETESTGEGDRRKVGIYPAGWAD